MKRIINTKVFKPKKSNYWKLLVKDKKGNYKVHFKSPDKKEVLKQRVKIQHELIETNTFVDTRISELDYYKLQVISKILKHKTFNKTISCLIDKAHSDYTKQQISLEK